MSSVDRHECEWVRDRIDAFVDGAKSDLSDAERLRGANHVESCTVCAQELALAERIRDGLHEMAFCAAPESVVDRAEREITRATASGNVVRLRARVRPRAARWVPAAVAAAALIAAVFLERDRRAGEIASSPEAIEAATREAAVAFAYLDKYARRTGAIVETEVLEQRLLAPMEKAMEKSGVVETKSGPGRS